MKFKAMSAIAKKNSLRLNLNKTANKQDSLYLNSVNNWNNLVFC